MKVDQLFSEAYAESREAFRNLLDPAMSFQPKAFLKSFLIDKDEDLTIDLIMALPEKKKKRLVFLSAGLHGIEGYIGAAILQLFVKEYLAFFDPRDTGLILVHAINPWGMKHRRRVNENNVDLNRNFIYSLDQDRQAINPAYNRVYALFNPSTALSSTSTLNWYLRLIRQIVLQGLTRLKSTFWHGQYRYADGLFYGGQGPEKSTRFMKKLFTIFEAYEQILVIDMHSGYGPRYQMAIVNSGYEKRSSSELVKLFSYPLVVKTGAQEFYALQGDMVDYIYCFANDRFPERQLYATSFEFGTLGESAEAAVRTMKALVDENCLYHHGAKNEKVAGKAFESFAELFYPSEKRWRLKAIEDARRAFDGIMKAEGFIT